MSEPWDAEYPVDATLARKLIEAQFPDLVPANLEPMAWGFDNTAFLVNRAWVFRFPRRAVALPGLDRELKVLPSVARRISVPVPLPERVGRPSVAYAHPFLGYRLLPGQTACRAGLSVEQRMALAAPLGHFLREVHAFPVSEALALGAGYDELGRLDVPLRKQKIRTGLADLFARGLVTAEELKQCERILELTPNPKDTPPVFLHGDLYSRHLLVDDQLQLTGVIDWGDLHVGHPASDLELARSFLPPRAWAPFCEAYGAIEPLTWWLARFRALSHTVAIFRFGHLIGDTDLQREARWSLDNLLIED